MHVSELSISPVLTALLSFGFAFATLLLASLDWFGESGPIMSFGLKLQMLFPVFVAVAVAVGKIAPATTNGHALVMGAGMSCGAIASGLLSKQAAPQPTVPQQTVPLDTCTE